MENTFYDFMTIDAATWGTEIDPIGLLAYQNYKRRRGVIGEAVKSPQQSFDFQRVMHGAMSRDEYQKKWKLGKYKKSGNKLAGPGGLYKNLVKSEDTEEIVEDLDIESMPLNEVLTLQQRQRRKILMKRLAPRLARARKISMRRRAGNDVLKRRARGAARKAMAKKLLGGRNKADVSPSERARVEKILAKRKTAVDRLATRFVPIVRKKQAARFAAKAAKKVAPKKAAPKPDTKPKPKAKPLSSVRPTAPVAPTAPK
jgi:hypothetical protein